MTTTLPILRRPQIETLLANTAQGECSAIYGLSNIGKSPLLRTLPNAEHVAAYQQLAGHPGLWVYVDCNRIVELTVHGFYEIVVRSLLEALDGESNLDTSPPFASLLQHLRTQHTHITTVTSSFQASLAFNQAIAECCQHLNRDLILILDEFDEIYAALEVRALLNLRALKDKFQHRLVYITATVRPLTDLRPEAEEEFAELFAAHPLPLGRLTSEDARHVIASMDDGRLSLKTQQTILTLAAGHFGLLTVLTQAALRAPNHAPDAAALAADPNARAECLKLWNQLRPTEQQAVLSLITETEAGLNGPMRETLDQLGLLTPQTEIFSNLFANFVRRQAATPAQVTGVVVDEDAGEVWVDGVKVTVLTELEYKLMRLLAQRPDRLTTKDMIVEAVWGNDYFDTMDDARIEKLVSRLRAKIEPDPAHPRYLLTQRGRGYKLSSQPVTLRDEDD